MPRRLVGYVWALGLASALSCVRPDSNAPSHSPDQASVPASDDVVARLIESSRSDDRVMEPVLALAGDIGARLTGSKNLDRAEQWCMERFSSWGLEVRREKWGELPAGFSRGERSGGMIVPEKIDYVFGTDAWTQGLDEPHRGAALLYPRNREELQAVRPRMKGAWIVHPRPGSELEVRDARVRASVDRVLDAEGVAGDIYPAGAADDPRVNIEGDYHVEVDEEGALVEAPRRLEINLRGDQYEDLVARLVHNDVVELQFAVDDQLLPGPVAAHNVIAEIPGRERPEELIIVAAHLDSWDGGVGAVDNGSGVATTMEAARLLAAVGAKPRRTIRFILFSGEEQGLLGSRAYVEQHVDELDRVSAILVHDFGTNYLSGLAVTPEMFDDFQSVTAPLQTLDAEMPFTIESVEALETDPSDHLPFMEKGVPGFFWRQSGRADYSRTHHTQLDVVEEVIPEYQRHSALVVAVTVWGLAELDHLLDRTNSAPIAPRQLGVRLRPGTAVVEGVVAGTMAESLGVHGGDELLSLDGETLRDLEHLVSLVRGGEPRKTLVLRRGEKRVELVLDFSDDPGERERAARREARARAKN